MISSLMMLLGGCALLTNPHARFAADPEFGYPPLVVHFNGSASTSPNGTIIYYLWDFDDGSTDTGAFVDHTFYDKGTYSVTLTVEDSNGAVGKITRSVKALNHAPTARFAVSPYIPQRNTETQFDAIESDDQDGYITSWQWSFDDETTATGEVVTHIFERAGTYSVRLTVVDNDGGQGVITKKVTIGGCNSCH